MQVGGVGGVYYYQQIATHLDQSNYLPNQKHGIVNKYELTNWLCVLLDWEIPVAMERCANFFFQGPTPAVFQFGFTGWSKLMNLIQDFQCWAAVTYWALVEML